MRESHSPSAAPVSVIPSLFDEPHYTPQQIAEKWTLSVDAVRKLFDHEDGVLTIGGAGKSGTRRYTTLRIPMSVMQRVHRKLSSR